MPDPAVSTAPGHFGMLRLRLGMIARWRPGTRGRLLFLAFLVGITGALAALAFKEATNLVQLLLCGKSGSFVRTFSELSPWQRVLVPTVGGLFAGLVLHLARRMTLRKATDYMEAVTLGDGYIPIRPNLLRSASSIFSIASGEAIGREGPLCQLAAATGSLLGRLRREPPARLRMLVACGAAAGIASAYNAPLAGALFVAEIIIGSVAIETLAPLLVSSITAAFTIRLATGATTLYPASFGNPSVAGTLFFLALGVAAGLAAPLFVTTLKFGRRAFSFLPDIPALNLTLGGLAVGLIALHHPEIVGNGQSVISGLFGDAYPWQNVAVILLLKVLVVALVFGSGAVGGVFTPSLLAGASLGYLCGCAAQALGIPSVTPVATAVVGMGAFLAAVTQAPAMAVLMLFEMTMCPGALLPLVVAGASAYAVVRALRADSLYRETLKSGPKSVFDRDLAALRTSDLLRPKFQRLAPRSGFSEITACFLHSGEPLVPVADPSGRYLGAVLLSDIRAYLKDRDFAGNVIARDLLHDEIPAIPADSDLPEALRTFSACPHDTLPVTAPDGSLAGTLARADLYLVISELTRRSGRG